mmetsp:Transcript_38164/g.85065  ORF Transcript_38164/g.85065 Transcript_38164/m.85065 type:complete len:686 (+) Transcript_38164:162-2219(+)
METFGRYPLLAAGVGSCVRVWDTSLGSSADRSSVLIESNIPVNSVQWNSNNKVLASAGPDGIVNMHTVTSPFTGMLFAGGFPSNRNGNLSDACIRCMRFSKNSKFLYVGHVNSDITVMDLKSQADTHTLTEHKAAITSLAVSQDDKFLASSSLQGSVLLHMAPSSPTPTPFTLHKSDGVAKQSLCYSMVQPYLAAGSDKSLMIWSISSNPPVPMQLPEVHLQSVTGVAFSPAHQDTLYSCSGDRRLTIWDLRTKDKVPQQVLLPSALTCLSVRDDGAYLALGAEDGLVYVMDMRKQQLLVELQSAAGSAVHEVHWQSTPKSKKVPPASSGVTAPASKVSSTAAAAPQARKAEAPINQLAPSSSGSSLALEPPSGAAKAKAPAAPKSGLQAPGMEAHTPPGAIMGAVPGATPGSDAMDLDLTPGPMLNNSSFSSRISSQQEGLGPTASKVASSAFQLDAVKGLSTRATTTQGRPVSAASEGAVLKAVPPSVQQSTSASTAAAPPATQNYHQPPTNSAAAAAEPTVLRGSNAANMQPRALPEQPSSRAAAIKTSAISSSNLDSRLLPTPGTSDLQHTTTSSMNQPSPASPIRPIGDGNGFATPRAARHLSENVFRTYMDDNLGTVREDVRNLHIEMIRQFHLQQMESNRIMAELLKKQDQLTGEVQSLRSQVEQLMRKQQSASVGWL